MKQKIFKFEFDPTYTDWVHAPSLRRAITFYRDQAGMTDNEMLDVEITPLPKSEWKDHDLVDSMFDEDGNAIVQTFAEWMEDNHDACGIVATTKY